MRIGYEITSLAPPRTGVGEYNLALLDHMMRQGGQVSFSLLSTGRRRPRHAVVSTARRHRHLPVPTRFMYKLWASGMPAVDTLLGGIDVYHATNYFLPPIRRARTVLTIFDLAFLLLPHLASPRIVQPFSRQLRKFAHQADLIVTCSQSTARDMESTLGLPPEKVCVVPGAVDEIMRPVGQEEAARALLEHYGIKTPFFLFVGTLEPRKNIEGLLTSFARTAGQIPHNLVLVGREGWMETPTDAMVRRLGLEERVHRIGYVQNRADLPVFYSAADAFVFPSLYEGFGLPVLEAMACGCPVIAANTSSLPEIAGDAAWLVELRDETSLGEAMLTLAQDGEQRAKLREAGIVQASRFSWERSAAILLAAYRSLA